MKKTIITIDGPSGSGKERIAKWAPFLAGARGIAESETPLGALLGIGETYGKSELAIDAARDAERVASSAAVARELTSVAGVVVIAEAAAAAAVAEA